MQPQSVIRDWQFEQMRRSLKIVAHLLELTPPADLTAYRDGGTGWTVLEVLCHLRDFEAIFLERSQITVEEDFGALPFPNPDQLAAERKYSQQSVERVFSEWARNREALLGYLAERSEDQWVCVANHPRRGAISLQDQLILTVWHDNNHLEQMMRILAEKQG